ncbi:Ppx/GppA phosphatase family-domain-containing protein [Dipodascopsis tothii]|uniref:Ppx/GppA phosphatase family-domain-containing protein n=1 Tax=Dipodascopsis tothii TaxID=44089 RepID=UPI0034CE6995
MTGEESERGGRIGIVDVGSNAVRLAVFDLGGPEARGLPTVYAERAKVSLFDAKANAEAAGLAAGTIPQAAVDALTAVFGRFARTCTQFGVAADRTAVLATDAVRSATNGESVLAAARAAFPAGRVAVLEPAIEASLGALGMATSALPWGSPQPVLAADVGGGSFQVSSVDVTAGAGGAWRTLSVGPGTSLPYGAGRLARLVDAPSSEREITTAIAAVLPPGPRPLLLSGGGFRGLGALCLAATPSPVPIVGGLETTVGGVRAVVAAARTGELGALNDHFRVSKRRAAQLPGVLMLASALLDATRAPDSTPVVFCLGGVKEGYAYALAAGVDPLVRAPLPLLDPLLVCTAARRPPLADLLTAQLAGVLAGLRAPPYAVRLAGALVNAGYAHAGLPKDTQAATALRATTSGALAGRAHGLIDADRALLAIALAERHGGDVFGADRELLGALAAMRPTHTWWAFVVGRIGGALLDVYPAGVADELLVHVEAATDGTRDSLVVRGAADPAVAAVWSSFEALGKLGKQFRKRYGGAGRKVDVQLVSEID